VSEGRTALQVDADPAIAVHGVVLQPSHDELHHFNGHGGFSRGRAAALDQGLRPQALMLPPVYGGSGVVGALHQLLFVSEMITGVSNQVVQERLQNVLSLAVQHGLVHFFGEGEQSLVLVINQRDPNGIIGDPVEHGIRHVVASK
jgi:hypothetical protein